MLRVTNLIGFGAGGKMLSTFALQGSATLSTSDTITAPSDINPGDLLILVDRATGAERPTSVIPSGWTAIKEYSPANAATIQLNVSLKVADGTEESASVSGMDGSAADSKIMACFRGNRRITAAMASGVVSEDSDGNPSGVSVAAAGANAPLLVIGVYSSSAIIDPRTFSTTKDAEAASADTTLYLAWKFYASAPADTTIDMDDEGSDNIIIGAYLTLSA